VPLLTYSAITDSYSATTDSFSAITDPLSVITGPLCATCPSHLIPVLRGARFEIGTAWTRIRNAETNVQLTVLEQTTDFWIQIWSNEQIWNKCYIISLRRFPGVWISCAVVSEQTECSETSAHKIQTPGITQNKEHNIQNKEKFEILKSTICKLICWNV